MVRAGVAAEDIACSSRVPFAALLALTVAAALVAALWLLVPGEARAARGLELGIQDHALFVQGNKRWPAERSFRYAMAIGVTRIRVDLLWAWSMPSPQAGARRRPSQIHYQFTQVDNLIDSARRHGIRVHLSLTGPSPRWANARRSSNQSWYKPNPREFGEFAGVVAKHFKGRATASGTSPTGRPGSGRSTPPRPSIASSTCSATPRSSGPTARPRC